MILGVDPLVHMREVAKSLGKDLVYQVRWETPEHFASSQMFCWAGAAMSGRDGGRRIAIFFNQRNAGECRNCSAEIGEYLLKSAGSQPQSVGGLGSFSSEADCCMLYDQNPRATYELDDSEVANIDIQQCAQDMFCLDGTSYSDHRNPASQMNYLRPKFTDVLQATSRDYRPHLHRVVELYLGIPKSSWHDPRMYSALDAIRLINGTAHALFDGSSYELVSKPLARLQGRSAWRSIPKLNLGPILLPQKGTDTVVHGAPYLIEYLSKVDAMSAADAERVIIDRLTNYLVHKKGFQYSRERAGRILEELDEQLV
jgi:hypothetical protein